MPADHPPVPVPSSAVLAADWEELARLAKAQIAAYQAYCSTPHPEEESDELAALERADDAYFDYATPKRIARLVAGAQRGAEDTARMDYLEDCDGTEWDAVPARCYNDELTVRQSIDAARRASPITETTDDR